MEKSNFKQGSQIVKQEKQPVKELWPKPSKSILRLAGKALVEFSMLEEGDRVLLGLSGGKDSLSLLHVLKHFQKHAPVRFELGVITVDPLSEDFSPEPLIPYLAELDIPYFYERQPIIEQAKTHMDGDSFCSFCARMRRGIMYRVAGEEGYNVLALAQHLDDLAESFLMSVFHGGKLKTMKANYQVRDGSLRVIRPLVKVRERQLAAFAKTAGLPVIHDNCPACFAMPTQRQYMKELLTREAAGNPHLMQNIFTAIKPLMARKTVEDEPL